MTPLSEARRQAEEALGTWHIERMGAALRALLAALPAEPAKYPGHDRIRELEALLRECNAVCLCGCPDGDHEADDCGESCGHDDRECIRVAPAVLAYVNALRAEVERITRERDEALRVVSKIAGSPVPIYGTDREWATGLREIARSYGKAVTVQTTATPSPNAPTFTNWTGAATRPDADKERR